MAQLLPNDLAFLRCSSWKKNNKQTRNKKVDTQFERTLVTIHKDHRVVSNKATKLEKSKYWSRKVCNENHTHPIRHSHLFLFGLLCFVIVEDLLLLIQLLESSTIGKRRNEEKAALKQQARENNPACFKMVNRSYSSSKVSTSGWQECMVGVKHMIACCSYSSYMSLVISDQDMNNRVQDHSSLLTFHRYENLLFPWFFLTEGQC